MQKSTVWLITFVVTCAVVFSCQSPLSTSERERLLAGERRWAARGFADYAIEMQSTCFCPSELTTWASVEVVGTSVHQVILATGEVITDYRRQWWQTVEQLFARIRAANGEEELDDVSFTLDSQLGFPTFVRWTPANSTLDGGGTITLRRPRLRP